MLELICASWMSDFRFRAAPVSNWSIVAITMRLENSRARACAIVCTAICYRLGVFARGHSTRTHPHLWLYNRSINWFKFDWNNQGDTHTRYIYITQFVMRLRARLFRNGPQFACAATKKKIASTFKICELCQTYICIFAPHIIPFLWTELSI